MTDLTVVILTKNEEKNLRKCVESFRGVAKRFVIVDSFSTDSTEGPKSLLLSGQWNYCKAEFCTKREQHTV